MIFRLVAIARFWIGGDRGAFQDQNRDIIFLTVVKRRVNVRKRASRELRTAAERGEFFFEILLCFFLPHPRAITVSFISAFSTFAYALMHLSRKQFRLETL